MSEPTRHDPNHPGTQVTVVDLASGDTETTVLKDNWTIICDGAYDVAHIASHANGTAVITVKRTNGKGHTDE